MLPACFRHCVLNYRYPCVSFRKSGKRKTYILLSVLRNRKCIAGMHNEGTAVLLWEFFAVNQKAEAGRRHVFLGYDPELFSKNSSLATYTSTRLVAARELLQVQSLPVGLLRRAYARKHLEPKSGHVTSCVICRSRPPSQKTHIRKLPSEPNSNTPRSL
jgi:hypothetical protein